MIGLAADGIANGGGCGGAIEQDMKESRVLMGKGKTYMLT